MPVPNLSFVNIAELVADRAHSIADPHGRRVDTKIYKIVQCGVGGWGEVEDGVRAGNGVLTLLQVLILPDPPGAINLSVVQEEVGVAWRRVKVAARITADPEMATGVYADVSCWEVSLHPVLEAGDVCAVGEKLICTGLISEDHSADVAGSLTACCIS